MNRPCRVVKVGGSLLAWPRWKNSLSAWLSVQTLSNSVIVIGGGASVDALRAAWTAGQLDDSAAHWQAIFAMSDNVRRVAVDFPEWTLVDRLGAIGDAKCAAGRSGRTWLLDPYRYLVDEDQGFAAGPLPQRWEVTSDSIAARVCEYLGADELVLLKSCLPEGDEAVLVAWADSGYVDPYFPRTACHLKHVRCVDLRSAGFPSVLAASSPDEAKAH